MADINFERREGYATITFNRPEAMNALNSAMAQDFAQFLLEVESDKSIRCVVIRSEGPHFMAGGDVKGFAPTMEVSDDERRRVFERRVQNVAPLLFALERMPQIVIASVRGAVAGAGVSFVAAADLAVASPNAYFLLAQIRLGLSPDGSATYFLPRQIGMKRAKEVALLGDRFTAEQAQQWGLVNRVVASDDELEAQTEKLAHRIARGPAVALGATKRLLNSSLQASYATQLQAEAESFAYCAATDDFKMGLQAFLDKKEPSFGRGES